MDTVIQVEKTSQADQLEDNHNALAMLLCGQAECKLIKGEEICL